MYLKCCAFLSFLQPILPVVKIVGVFPYYQGTHVLHPHALHIKWESFICSLCLTLIYYAGLQVNFSLHNIIHLFDALGQFNCAGIWRVLAWSHLPVQGPVPILESRCLVLSSLRVIPFTLKPFGNVMWLFRAFENPKTAVSLSLWDTGSQTAGPCFPCI